MIHKIALLEVHFLFNYSIDCMEFTNLSPVLGDGFKPILKAVFPSLIGFPFGELIAFTILIPKVANIKKAKTVGMISVFLSGLLLWYTTVIQIVTLGCPFVFMDRGFKTNKS